ncbi:OsmC family protein [Dactylosporangium sp. CS-047395]|uniref:OsmC family protein n=1 Tax=Dactylosporangium sp. CS-047395 TaxID=3239936 RepID=UPI003D924199
MDELTVTLEQSGRTATVAGIRAHTIVMDRPEAQGGTDAGPMGGETLLAAVGGCLMSTLYAAANARSIDVKDATCTVSGTFAASPRRFGSLRIDVACSSLPADELAHLVEVASRGCLVVATLRQGMDVVVGAV